MTRHIRPLLVALGVAMLFSALGVGVVLAQGGGDGDGDKRARMEESRAAFAEALGVTVEDLAAARKQVALDRIDAAVEAGKLTGDEAAAIRAKIESGDIGMDGDGKGKRRAARAFKRGKSGDDGAARGEALAAALGVTVDDLAAARKQVALDRIDAAVEAGKITGERAEKIRAAIESGEKPDFGKERRGHHGRFDKDGSAMEKPASGE